MTAQHIGFLVLVLLAVSVYGERPECPSTPPAATITFQASCTTLNLTDPSCWSPARSVQNSDVVTFAPGTKATMPFQDNFAPVAITALVVPAGVNVVMNGGVFTVQNCIYVAGGLDLFATNIDNGTKPASFWYPSDPSVPNDQSCQTVSQGFTPRVCGPAKMVVTGTVTLSGLYASLFAETTVATGGKLIVGSGGFLWGNLTNHGTISGSGVVYMHGALYNFGSATFGTLRFDSWATTFNPTATPVMMYNEGNLTINDNGEELLVSTEAFYPKDNTTGSYGAKFVNHGTMFILSAGMAGTYVDLFNFGSVTFSYKVASSYYVLGSSLNMGTFTAVGCDVYLNDYISSGGHLVTEGHGTFHMGNAAGVDEKTVRACETKQKDKLRHIAFGVSRANNAGNTTACSDNSQCASGQCCQDNVCQPSNCPNGGRYGGGFPICCSNNAFCGASSHGPYCGGRSFVWEMNLDCLDTIDFVDRYEADIVKKMFARLPEHKAEPGLPTFGAARYSFRGNSVVRGDGTGAVVITEPVEFRDDVVVSHGGTLRTIFEGGAVPFRGDATLHIKSQGSLVLGVRATLDRRTRVNVHEGGLVRVPRFNHVHLMHDEANFHVKAGARLHVDGALLVQSNGGGKKHVATHCGELKGTGNILGDVSLLVCPQQ